MLQADHNIVANLFQILDIFERNCPQNDETNYTKMPSATWQRSSFGADWIDCETESNLFSDVF